MDRDRRGVCLDVGDVGRELSVCNMTSVLSAGMVEGSRVSMFESGCVTSALQIGHWMIHDQGTLSNELYQIHSPISSDVSAIHQLLRDGIYDGKAEP